MYVIAASEIVAFPANRGKVWRFSRPQIEGCNISLSDIAQAEKAVLAAASEALAAKGKGAGKGRGGGRG